MPLGRNRSSRTISPVPSISIFPATLLRPVLLGLFAAFFFAASSWNAAFSQQTAKAASSVKLTASTVESAHTQVSLTAQVVAPAASGAVPTGSISFMSGEHSIGAAFLDSDGRAAYTASLPPGEQKITAVYQGDSSFEPSSSSPATVNAAASGVPGFTLAASNSTLSVVAGNTATTVVTLTPDNGFVQAVSLSCSGVPYASVTCVFSPAQVTPGAPTTAAPNGTPAISTLSILTTAYSGALRDPFASSNQIAYGLALPGMLALAGLGIARKRGRFGKHAGTAKSVALLVLLFAGGIGLGGCSQRYTYFHRPPSGNPGTPAGAYTVVITGITGTGSTLTTASVPVTMTVTI